MKIKATLCLSLLAVAPSLMQARATIGFTSGEGFTDGNLNGQQGWSIVYGSDPSFEVSNASSSGTLSQAAINGALQKTFSTEETGITFDNTASVMQYDINFTFNTKASSPAFNGMGVGIGGGLFQNTVDVGIFFRDNGTIQVFDGLLSGGDRSFGSAITEGTNLTLSLIVNWADETYTISRSDAPSATRTDYAFAKGSGSQGGNYLRLDSLTTLADYDLNSISIGAVIPEPPTVATLLGLSALAACILYRKRRR